MLSVQLARLAVWIHTFVPGLPLSVLDHRLVHGNALVGVGTPDEIQAKLEEKNRPGERTAEKDLPLFGVDAESLLAQATRRLNRLANINDATLRDIEEARNAMREASAALAKTAALCDMISAVPITDDKEVHSFLLEDWQELPDDLETRSVARKAHEELAGLVPLHFPIAFPEVFLRRRRGFDVIVGNPPWEKVKVENHAFWARHFPGFRGLRQREQEAEKSQLRAERPDLVEAYESERAEMGKIRRMLVSGTYPGIGTGAPDLYKAFCWRFWHLTMTDGGRIGVVLPRSAFSAKGSTKFRRKIFAESAKVDIDMLLNRAGWVFDEAEHRYTIGLVCIAHGTPTKKSISLRGPFASFSAFAIGSQQRPVTFARGEVLTWNDSASLPLLPTEDSVGVFAQLRKAPRVSYKNSESWMVRPARNETETKDRESLDLDSKECPKGWWRVLKGESFGIWSLREDRPYGFANPEEVLPWLPPPRDAIGCLRHRGKKSPCR